MAWTADMGRCIRCTNVDKCPDRKKIMTIMSKIVYELNTDEISEKEGGNGVIVVACNGK